MCNNWINVLFVFSFYVLSAAWSVHASLPCDNIRQEVTVPLLIRKIPRQFLTSSERDLLVSLKWRSEILRLRLTPHNISPEGTVAEWHEGTNLTEIETLRDDTLYYRGNVVGRDHSYVALQIDGNKISGMIQNGREGIFIEPHGTGILTNTTFGPHNLASCGLIQAPPMDLGQLSHRTRRAPGSYTKYLEVLIAADTSVVDFIGKDRIKSYLLTLMNIVNTIYHDDSLGTNIEVVTVKIMYMDKDSERSVVSENNPQSTVDRFCQWVSSQTYRSARSGPGANHDVAVLLTRHKFATAGYAPITGLCLPMRNCALVRDDGFTSAFVIAHEMAHIFGLMHDGHGNSCHGSTYRTSIMATVVQSSFNHYWWSPCSKTKMAEVIGHLYCLNNNPFVVIKEDLRIPLGQSWSLDEQCRLEFGGNARFCRAFTHIDPCNQMWCTDETRRYSCKTKNVVPLDGTQCGGSPQYYCQGGSCGYHGSQSPIDGGWSQWTQWSTCSENCGVGFKRRSRSCDSPAPEYEGKDCEGESENSDTCFTQVCTEYVDKRALQCSMMDIVPVRGKTYTWLPYQTNKDDDLCKLTCVSTSDNRVVTFDSLVDNGTPCFYGESNFICLDGTCAKVGCDGVRGSNLKLDECGVCQGNGSTCKHVTGTYSKKFDYSAGSNIYKYFQKYLIDDSGKQYDTVVVLPKGSRNITVKELATSPHFLSLQDTYYYNYAINGDGKQGSSKNFVIDGAWFEYKNNRGHELLTSNGPVHRDVNVLVYPNHWQHPAQYEFSYTVDKDDYTLEKNKYVWKYEDWSPCSVSCGKGVQHIIYGCYDKVSDEKVDEEKCQYIKGKDADDVPCEMVDCSSLSYIWRMLRNYSECSESCGNTGVRHQMSECERLSDSATVDPVYCNHSPKPISIEPCNRKKCETVKYRYEVTTEWSECSTSCGTTGTQHQLFYCVREYNDQRTEKSDEKFCADLKSPKEPRPCNRIPCKKYQWKVTAVWLACNETCGTSGEQLKREVCNRLQDNVIVHDRFCLHQKKSSESQPCNRRACLASYKWVVTSEWSECSHTCGNQGMKERKLACKNVTYDDRERDVPVNFCDVDTKPVDREDCNRTPCESFFWSSNSKWSECSETCGDTGTQTHIYVCRSNMSNNIVDDSSCKDIEVSRNERPCNRLPCFTFEWRLQDSVFFPECAKSCSDSFVESQTQNISCYKVFANGDENESDLDSCDLDEKPVNTRPCTDLDCTKFRWNRSNDWSKCDVPCGSAGTQRMKSECVTLEDGIIKVVSDENCGHKARPIDLTRFCSSPACYKYVDRNDAGWGPCSVSCGKGIQVKNQKCVEMNGGAEREVKQSQCKDAGLLETTQSCDLGPCNFLEWGAGPWSMCSKTCGSGQQKRIIYCGDPTKPSDQTSCPGKAPDEYRPCSDGPCVVGKPPNCEANRAKFCTRANTRLCSHPAYERVCCVACQQFQRDQAWIRRRRRFYIFRG
ncbi:LOW QUALITY PROTEIN: A disintegrin and metalloproteinase with thrombospondin motifs 3-like [Ruditapes philippinarum]|uniref:LOW QUALITY PROTEIN: A disintegrin and metalloproteinase with thrombospondin motifs 3-like n=1 Tax=Ruditapes philippinarum TaxID=129788 RepID=UPI00295BD16D|nr:LOW QUALITY PROTEIN: A disintegrin and metalloproteinase with thrombospondin motifs 3-like [Ruditapes philippinarum]